MMNEEIDKKDNKENEKKQEEIDVKTTQIEIKENVEPDNMVTLPSGKVVSKRKYEAIKKLQEKILEYINNSITELHIILEPLTLIINLNEIKELKQWLEFYKETNNKPINIYFETIDLSNEEYYLINFNKVIENLRNLNLKYIFDLKINEFL